MHDSRFTLEDSCDSDMDVVMELWNEDDSASNDMDQPKIIVMNSDVDLPVLCWSVISKEFEDFVKNSDFDSLLKQWESVNTERL